MNRKALPVEISAFTEKHLFLFDFSRLLCQPLDEKAFSKKLLVLRRVQYRFKKCPNRRAFSSELIDGNDRSFRALQAQCMLP